MDGMTRAEVDGAEAKDFALGGGAMRPRDAATMIVLDRTGGKPCVLMGRRHVKHAFMPGKLVFPGGRTDPHDGRVPVADDLHPAERARLTRASSSARARAIAVSALRETYEEAGLLIGKPGSFESGRPEWRGFAVNRVKPSLETLRFVARAITPPGRVRRFDTRFFAVWRSDVAVELPERPSDELQALVWLTLDEARRADVPTITGAVLDDLQKRLAVDSDLRPGGGVPFYRMVRDRFVREML